MRRGAQVVLIVAACVSGCAAQGPADAPPVTVTVTETATPAPPPQTASPEPSSAAPVAAAPSPTPTPTTFVMPDVVGQNLQYAQDALQALGSFLMDQQDAAGLGRMQVLDSNWQICSQDPAAGTEAPLEQLVTLRAVKLDETCPAS